MRLNRVFAAGRAQAPFNPWPNSIFTRNNENSPRTVSRSTALKLANQLNYGNQNYSYDGKAAPSFFGYEEGAGIGKYGYGGLTWAFQTVINLNSFTQALWCMPPGSPRQKVLYTNGAGEPWPKGTAQDLQKYMESVPMPHVAKVPAGSIVAGGSDKEMTILDLGTGEMWEIFGMKGAEGEYKTTYGGYVGTKAVPGGGWTTFAEGNGIYPNSISEGAWGARASSLYGFAGQISNQDMVEVLRGGKIKHALQVALPVTATAAVLPSTRHDSSQLIPEKIKAGEQNPAWNASGIGHDAVGETAWFMFPKASRPSEFGITLPFETAIFEAIREYGVFVADTSGACSFAFEWPGSLGSPYSWAKVNPWAAASAAEYHPAYVPASWEDPSLPAMTEQPYSGNGEHGFTSGMLKKQPWKELEQLEPFAS